MTDNWTVKYFTDCEVNKIAAVLYDKNFSITIIKKPNGKFDAIMSNRINSKFNMYKIIVGTNIEDLIEVCKNDILLRALTG